MQVTSSCLESSFSDRLVSGNDLLGKFKLPERFSRQTMQAIAEKVITKRARTEIISTMAGEMWRYTETPSSSEYNGVCQLLLKKFPCLKDTIGTGYVSKSLFCCICACVYLVPASVPSYNLSGEWAAYLHHVLD